MTSHLKFSAGVADLIDVGQRPSVVRRPGLRQAELLDLLKLHLSNQTRRADERQASWITLGRNAAHSFVSHPSFLSLSTDRRRKNNSCADALTLLRTERNGLFRLSPHNVDNCTKKKKEP